LQFVIHFLGLGRVLLGELGDLVRQLLALEGGFFRRAGGPGGQGAGEGGGEGELDEGFHGSGLVFLCWADIRLRLGAGGKFIDLPFRKSRFWLVAPAVSLPVRRQQASREAHPFDKPISRSLAPAA